MADPNYFDRGGSFTVAATFRLSLVICLIPFSDRQIVGLGQVHVAGKSVTTHRTHPLDSVGQIPDECHKTRAT